MSSELICISLNQNLELLIALKVLKIVFLLFADVVMLILLEEPAVTDVVEVTISTLFILMGLFQN